MNQLTNIRKLLLNREVGLTFLILLGIWVAGLNFDFLKPLLSLVFAGYSTYRHYLLFGDFATQMYLSHLLVLIYSYLVALVVGNAYRSVAD